MGIVWRLSLTMLIPEKYCHQLCYIQKNAVIMKILKSKIRYRLYNIPIYGGSFALLYFYSDIIAQALNIFDLSLLLLFILLFSPLAKLQLQSSDTTSDTTPSFLSLLKSISLIQLALTTLFLFFLTLNYKLSITPLSTKTMSADPYLLIFQSTLVPWAIVCAFTLLFAYCYYCLNQSGVFSSLFNHLFKFNLAIDNQLVINILTMVPAQVILATFIGLLTITTAFLLNTLLHLAPLSLGPTITTFLIILPLSIFPATRTWRRAVRSLCGRFPIMVIIGIYILFMSSVLCILNSAAHWLHVNSSSAQSVNQDLLFSIHTLWHNRWQTIIFCFWGGLTLYLSTWLARYCRGYSFKHIIYASMLTPSLLFLLGCLAVPLLNNNILFYITQHDILFYSLFIVSLLLFSIVISQFNNTYRLSLGFLPNMSDIKQRPVIRFMNILLNGSTLLLTCYLLAGIYAMQSILLTVCIPLFIVFIVSLGSYFRIKRSIGDAHEQLA